MDAPDDIPPLTGLGDPIEPIEPRDEWCAPSMAFCSRWKLGDARPDPFPAGVGLPWFVGLCGTIGGPEKLRRLPAEPEADGVRIYRGGVL